MKTRHLITKHNNKDVIISQLFVSNGMQNGLTSPYSNEYQAGEVYNSGSIVTVDGDSYVSLVNNNINDPSSNTWRKMKPTHIWENKRYDIGELVVYNGHTYRSKVTQNNNSPDKSDFWEILSLQYVQDSRVHELRKYKKPYYEVDFVVKSENIGSKVFETKIINENEDRNELVYEYVFDQEAGDKLSGLVMKDFQDEKLNLLSQVKYYPNIDNEQSITALGLGEDYLVGLSETPKIKANELFIDRGNHTSTEKHLKLGEITSIEGFNTYNNGGYFNIKNN